MREDDVGLLGLDAGHSATGAEPCGAVSDSEQLKESDPIRNGSKRRWRAKNGFRGIKGNESMFSDVEGYSALAQRRVTHRAVRASCGGA